MAFGAFFSLALIFHAYPIHGMLDCDPTFVKKLDHYLSSKVPKDVPDRKAFLESVNKEIFSVYWTSFRDKPYLRIIGINMFLEDIKTIKQKLMRQMKQSLEHFADIACTEDCSVTEGPVLDCWTCLRIRAQCFKGSVCGEQDDLVLEKKEVAVYLFLVLEFALMFFFMVLGYLYFKKKMMMLKEKEIKILTKKKKQEEIEDGSHNK
ncbi:izumo sperm-egg fusion protein 3 isoform X2 [Hyla sarda]|uniref:izumo sperm-egg fusion protein 3 isoform X2 n=1 Tax=Hyla sarda TaxID=327740 RepID=UPI0024C21A94|nr:izumo sperm-egg fusion protein 3 isoform X2 [Hyla sarda]